MKQPCDADCPGRSATCHAECERYLLFAAENERNREDHHRRKKVYGYIRDAVRASKKSSKAWKGKV